MSRLAIIGTVVFLAIYFFLGPAFARTPRIDVIEVDGVISPASAEYIIKNLARASRAGAEALIITMDTPGGLDLSLRKIIKEILNSDIPVVVFVGPSGARAASAGAIITLAAHVAAMAPGTNIGAAHPVAMGGGKMSKTMEETITTLREWCLTRSRSASLTREEMTASGANSSRFEQITEELA